MWMRKDWFSALGSIDLLGANQRDSLENRDVSTEKTPANDSEKTMPSAVDESIEELPNSDAQGGVKRAEAITLVWSRTSLILVYALIFLIYFVNSLQQQITGNLTAYVVSDFSLHSLIPVISIVSSIMGGVLQLPTAKVLDLWGRSEGFAVMVFISTIGLVLMAVCQNVETYAAAQIFYSVGFTGLGYILEVVIADTSSLKNRALAFAFSSSPYIATTFAGPSAAESFYEHSNFRWAFGCFAIITPVISLPVFTILLLNQIKAKKIGILAKEPSGRNILQSIWHYIVEFDALGVFLLSAGLVLFLLPFSLAGYETDKWESASIITMLVIGFVLLVAFAISERYIARKPFIPFHLLLSRTVIGACMLSATLFIAYYCWDGYYTSYLQVVHDLSISQAGYVANIYNIGACFWAIIVGLLIRTSGRFKWLAWAAVPVQLLGGGLMIHFRHPNTPVGYVVMCQIFIALAGGTLVICEQMAVMAVCEHGEVAALLALLGLFSSVGGAVGSSVSGAIWTNTLPGALLELLPDAAKANVTDIYADLEIQLSYPVGDPVRTAIMEAYGIAQQRMCIAGTAILILAFVWVSMWKDVKVSEFKQVKGRVF
ncbi:putative siderochrome-iron transporter [Glonium stellatum]|uniref:Putative siderochrome-iron transporter n=1 Tax=Glonium stellatum TaxID=574774 RepID=A0A8E2EU57_9PEZI|nr:putative siderochrome-iron transporter [Glonium stellatum]